MKNVEDIIVAYLHDDASADEVRDLFEWVRENPKHAKEFARYSLLHAQLRRELSGQQQAKKSLGTSEENDPNKVTPESPSHRFTFNDLTKGRGVRFAVLAALAASLLAVVVVMQRDPNEQNVAIQPSPPLTLASIAQTVDVVWSSDKSFTKNDRIAADILQLRQGIVRLEFDSGVRVTLQGPAQFELLSHDHTRLISGLLTATVPPGAEGFRVDTPHAEVTDLGTAFGIHIDGDMSNVSVFDGEVDVALSGSEAKRLLKEGEAARIGTGKTIESTEFQGKVFEKLWPVSSGIESSTGAFRFTPQWPRHIRFIRSDDDIFVAPEGYITTLAEPLKVNIFESGEYVRESELKANDLPSGTKVRSFILHFHPEHRENRRNFGRTTGSIRFDRPVLGLIFLHPELAASADRFPGRRAGEALEHRQLELTGNRVGDVISLSDDRQTVTVDLAAPTRFSDLIRVIVDASSPQQTDLNNLHTIDTPEKEQEDD